MSNRTFRGTATQYAVLHQWVRRHLGKPQYCISCGTTDPDKNYEWANVSGEYKRDLSDWERKCHKCHMRADLKRIACTNGHLYTSDNLVIRKNGHRECRECRKISLRNFRKRQKQLLVVSTEREKK